MASSSHHLTHNVLFGGRGGGSMLVSDFKQAVNGIMYTFDVNSNWIKVNGQLVFEGKVGDVSFSPSGIKIDGKPFDFLSKMK